jgi:hypothetical protein
MVVTTMKHLINSRYIAIESPTPITNDNDNNNNSSSSSNDTKLYRISISIGKKLFQWKVIVFNRYNDNDDDNDDSTLMILDVVPLKVTSLNDIEGYNYYNSNIINDIMLLIPTTTTATTTIKEISNILMRSIVSRHLIQYSLDKWKFNGKLSFILSFFSDIDNSSILTINNYPNNNDRNDQSSYTIIIEVPIILNMHCDDNSEYLIDIVKDNPILLLISITVINMDITIIKVDVLIPKTMKCSSNLELSQTFKDNKINDFKVEDICGYVEDKIFKQWYYRKLFTEEMMKSAAVLEYDAIDFSYVLIVIRLKYNNAFASCTVEFVFTHPMVMPNIEVQDLLNSFDTKLETSSISTSQAPNVLAQELLKYATKAISSQAFSNL